MPKISRDNGPSFEGGHQTPADVLRERGKLGPYEEEGDVTLQICAECGTACAAGLEACPHCQSTDLTEEGAGEVQEHPAEQPEEEQLAEGDDGDNEVAPDAEPVDATPPRPATNAKKAEWVTYVEALSGEDVDGLTKDELVEFADTLEDQDGKD